MIKPDYAFCLSIIQPNQMTTNLKHLVLRPGPGWQQHCGPVWQHRTGTRIHWSAPIVRLPDMTMPPIYPDLKRLNTAIRINGGNRKRGVMAYALTVYNEWLNGSQRISKVPSV
jgi:hypothetical protein